MEQNVELKYLGVGYIFDISTVISYLNSKSVIKAADISTIEKHICSYVEYILLNNGYIVNTQIKKDDIMFLNNKYMLNNEFLDYLYNIISKFIYNNKVEHTVYISAEDRKLTISTIVNTKEEV